MPDTQNIYESVRDAYARIRQDIVKTPMIQSKAFSDEFPCSLFVKLEHRQRTGSFKLRGAHSKLSLVAKSQEKQCIVTASTGNHGLACLDAMSRYGVKGKIVVPETVSQCKKDKLLSLGAELVLHGTDCEETETAARAMASETVQYVSPYNDLDIVAGQGTLGLEILEQCPGLEYLFISVGGGGLVAGVAAVIKYLRPSVVIVGCQPEASPVMMKVICNPK